MSEMEPCRVHNFQEPTLPQGHSSFSANTLPQASHSPVPQLLTAQTKPLIFKKNSCT